MEDGTEVQAAFDGWVWLEPVEMLPADPPILLPVFPPDVWDPRVVLPPADGEYQMTLLLAVEDLPTFDDAALAIEVGEGDWWETDAAWADGDVGPDGWVDEGDLTDLWVEYADDVPLDQSDWWTGDGADGSDWFAGEVTDDWLVTDLGS